MNTIKLNNTTVKMIAHRGLSGLEKENTASAFVAAGNRAKYFGIETDVHVTADGKLIVIHDDDTKRVALDKLCVEESTYDTLKKLQLVDIDGVRGRRDLILPDLEDYISICKKYEKTAILELKNPMPGEAIDQVIEVIRGLGYLENTVFISFALSNLVLLRERLPEQKAQYLIEDAWHDDVYDDMVKYHLDLDIDHHLLTKEIADKVHELGFELNVWTVNTVEDAERVIDLGVDYITTNILE